MSDICVGDIVQLNSGSPDMTVGSIEGDQAVCELPGGRGPATYPLEALTFLRRVGPCRQHATRTPRASDA